VNFFNKGNKAFWAERARLHGKSPHGSWEDTRMMELEFKALMSYLPQGTKTILDIGAGPGHVVHRLQGEGYNACGVEREKQWRDSERGIFWGEAIPWLEGTEGDGCPDVIYTVRTLINMPYKEQERAVDLMLQKARKRVILIEEVEGAREEMNLLREGLQLHPLEHQEFNLPVNSTSLRRRGFREVSFADVYYFFTRVIGPLLTRELGYDTIANRLGLSVQTSNPHAPVGLVCPIRLFWKDTE